MAEIYRAARTVIVWLGGGGHRETQYAVKLLERISAAPIEKLNNLKNSKSMTQECRKYLGNAVGQLIIGAPLSGCSLVPGSAGSG
jgi:hypothetical protein